MRFPTSDFLIQKNPPGPLTNTLASFRIKVVFAEIFDGSSHSVLTQWTGELFFLHARCKIEVVYN